MPKVRIRTTRGLVNTAAGQGAELVEAMLRARPCLPRITFKSGFTKSPNRESFEYEYSRPFSYWELHRHICLGCAQLYTCPSDPCRHRYREEAREYCGKCQKEERKDE